jgi:hypothetical protein
VGLLVVLLLYAVLDVGMEVEQAGTWAVPRLALIYDNPLELWKLKCLLGLAHMILFWF